MRLESIGYLALSAFLVYVVLAGSLYLFLPRAGYDRFGSSIIQERYQSVLYTAGGHYVNLGEYLGAIATTFILNLVGPIFFLGGGYLFLFGSLILFLESLEQKRLRGRVSKN